MNKRGVDTRGIQRAEGKTFFWKGEYGENVNEAKTLQTDLNVFATFQPHLPAEYLNSDYLFLANIDPVLQANVRRSTDITNPARAPTRNYRTIDHRKSQSEML